MCDKLMRHTGSLGRLVTTALLAVAFTPVTARLCAEAGDNASPRLLGGKAR